MVIIFVLALEHAVDSHFVIAVFGHMVKVGEIRRYIGASEVFILTTSLKILPT